MKFRGKMTSIAMAMASMMLFAVDAVPGKTGQEGVSWKKFAGGGVSFKVPERWKSIDPFTADTPHWDHFWYPEMPTHGTRMALLKSPAPDEFQVLLQLGAKTELAPVVNGHITKFNDHPQNPRIIQHTGRSVDRVEVRLFTVQLAAAGPGEKDKSYIVGYAVLGDRLFVMNGGALTNGFDHEILYDLIQSLDLGTR